MRKISTNLTYHLQELNNNDDNKVKVNRKKAIIKITGEINKTEAKKWKKFIKPRIGLLKTFKNHQTYKTLIINTGLDKTCFGWLVG